MRFVCFPFCSFERAMSSMWTNAASLAMSPSFHAVLLDGWAFLRPFFCGLSGLEDIFVEFVVIGLLDESFCCDCSLFLYFNDGDGFFYFISINYSSSL